jgi:site-specific recombinase
MGTFGSPSAKNVEHQIGQHFLLASKYQNHGLLGRFFGIPFDIRHVTIAAGNASIGFYGLDPSDFDPSFLWPVFIGVMSIGFLNFLISFSLSFYVAMRSRGLYLHQMPTFLRELGRRFVRRPLDFFRPPKDVRS